MTKDELVTLLKGLDENVTDQIVNEIIKKADQNKDGKIQKGYCVLNQLRVLHYWPDVNPRHKFNLKIDEILETIGVDDSGYLDLEDVRLFILEELKNT